MRHRGQLAHEPAQIAGCIIASRPPRRPRYRRFRIGPSARTAARPHRLTGRAVTRPGTQVLGSMVRDACQMLGRGWMDQWRRVHRRLDSVRTIYSGQAVDLESALDDVQSLFECLHHLKDWLGNDSAINVTKADGDALISSSQALRVCADIANGAKHLVLTSSRTGDAATSITRNDAIVFVGTGTTAYTFVVASGSKELDVLSVGEQAVADWETFLRTRGLL